ncbi:MAG TPA: lamin tail domain-containing protein [Cellvibrionaceae bacterium]|nr:lamin tail domain-containing protein [Cellvibrionaceae bacterium]
MFIQSIQWRAVIAVFAALCCSQHAQAASPDLVISQVYGGGGSAGAPYSHDFIEVFNRGTAPVNLNGWSLQYASAAGNSWTNKTLLGNTLLAPGQYYLVQGASNGANGAAVPGPDVTGSINLGGTAGKLALVNTTTTIASGIACPSAAEGLVDFVAYGSTASNCAGMGVTPAPSVTTSIKRAAGGCTDTDNNPSDFAALAPAPRNSTAPLSPCGGGATISLSASGTSLSETGGAITLTITASAPVSADVVLSLTVTGTGITAGDYNLASTITILSGQTTGSTVFSAVNDGVAEGAETALITMGNPPAGYSLGVASQSITLSDGGAATTPIYQIQGNQATSPLVGQQVTTSGVVTRVNNNGFFMQDASGDGDATTSDGILVFTNTAPTVTLGQLIQLTGTVAEFNTGAASNADTLAHRVTEITSPSNISDGQQPGDHTA